MRRNVLETVMGAVVLLVAFVFLAFAYSRADVRAVQGYEVTAQFTNIGGLQAGSDVRISGVKVGSVTRHSLDKMSYLAIVHMSIEPDIELPTDTVATIASESLLGGKFMALEPGGSPDIIEAGGRIEYTQSTPGFEQLLGQVVYNLQNLGEDGSAGGGQ